MSLEQDRQCTHNEQDGASA